MHNEKGSDEPYVGTPRYNIYWADGGTEPMMKIWERVIREAVGKKGQSGVKKTSEEEYFKERVQMKQESHIK